MYRIKRIFYQKTTLTVVKVGRRLWFRLAPDQELFTGFVQAPDTLAGYQGISGSVNTAEWRGAVSFDGVSVCLCARSLPRRTARVSESLRLHYYTWAFGRRAARRHCSADTELWLWPGAHDGRVLDVTVWPLSPAPLRCMCLDSGGLWRNGKSGELGSVFVSASLFGREFDLGRIDSKEVVKTRLGIRTNYYTRLFIRVRDSGHKLCLRLYVPLVDEFGFIFQKLT